MKHAFTYRISLLALMGLFLTGCFDFSWDDASFEYELTPQTEILRIEIEPNPVVAGESITFTCIIKDSLDPSFYYQWDFNFENDSFLDSTTTENSITLVSTEVPGTYNGYIAVFNDSNAPNESAAYGDFQYDVIEKVQ